MQVSVIFNYGEKIFQFNINVAVQLAVGHVLFIDINQLPEELFIIASKELFNYEILGVKSIKVEVISVVQFSGVNNSFCYYGIELTTE